MLTVSTEERITVEEALNHRWGTRNAQQPVVVRGPSSDIFLGFS